MKNLLLALVVVFALGCSGDQASTDSTGTSPAAGKQESANLASTEEKAKCGQCNTEYPKAELASHDNILICKSCLATHNH
ncbi:MAG TPA: hypothetical protein PKA27_12345 [Fimbriimonadaceae bacterium]|nr:hypothetical protein [Fimbriimonadaceae bacterium]